MTATRRHIIRRIQRETGISLRRIVRESFGLTAVEITRRYFPLPARAAGAAAVAIEA